MKLQKNWCTKFMLLEITMMQFWYCRQCYSILPKILVIVLSQKNCAKFRMQYNYLERWYWYKFCKYSLQLLRICALTRGLCRRKIEFIFAHFTKFNIRKWTLHKIQYQKNGFFTKFNIRKTVSSQNSIYRHGSFHHFWRIRLFFFFCFKAF